MKTYYFVETCKGWKNGSGWSYESTTEDGFAEYDELPDEGDLKNVIRDTNAELVDTSTADDIEVTWSFYASKEDYIDGKEPIQCVSAWINDTLEEASGYVVVDKDADGTYDPVVGQYDDLDKAKEVAKDFAFAEKSHYIVAKAIRYYDGNYDTIFEA